MSVDAEPVASPAPRWLRFAPLGLAVIGLAAIFISGAHEHVSFSGLAAREADLRAFVEARLVLAVLAYMALYASLVAVSFPGAGVLTIAGGFLLAPALGLVGAALATVLTATAGAVAVFLIARTAVGDAWRDRLSGSLAKIKAGFDADALSYLFVLRLAPVFPFFVVNAAAGLLGVRLRPYVVSTLFGIAPGSFVYTALGAGSADILAAGGEASLSAALGQPSVIVAIAGLIALALVPPAIKAGKAISARGR